jgi:hypothetical protein
MACVASPADAARRHISQPRPGLRAARRQCGRAEVMSSCKTQELPNSLGPSERVGILRGIKFRRTSHRIEQEFVIPESDITFSDATNASAYQSVFLSVTIDAISNAFI